MKLWFRMVVGSSVLGGHGSLIAEHGHQVVVNHVLLEVHVVARARVEEHTAAFVESAEPDPVLLVHLLLLERDFVPLAIISAKPFGFFWGNNRVLVPLPEAKLLDRGQASFVPSIFDLVLIVHLGQED